jgi:tryptophan halogenase
MVKRVLVLGGGSAGFIAAVTLKSQMPDLPVVVVRSKDIGIIGVGEGTTTSVPDHLFRFCKIPAADFYRQAEPVWKLGIRLLWGTRPHFDFAFSDQLDSQIQGFSRSTGFYYDAFPGSEMGVDSALMTHNRAFARRPGGMPFNPAKPAMHIENEKFVAFLERYAAGLGVQVRDDTVRDVLQDDAGVTGLKMASGETLDADLYLDCSGFASVLLGKALAEPFVSYRSSLYCDRAVIGGWARGADESIKPYTTAETMDAGWCWQIEHEHRVIRGYVYGSDFIPDDAAEREFRAKNPKLTSTRVVRFVSGRYRRTWVKNVVAIGNASGFVEPLEATALAVICHQSAWLTLSLIDSQRQLRPSQVRMCNRASEELWEQIRRFLAVHYKFNRRLDTPFWRECREKTDLAGAEPFVEYYQANGPSTVWKPLLVGKVAIFPYEGYLSMFCGQDVPHEGRYTPTPAEAQRWQQFQRHINDIARSGYTVPEALRLIRSPNWAWPTAA